MNKKIDLATHKNQEIIINNQGDIKKEQDLIKNEILETNENVKKLLDKKLDYDYIVRTAKREYLNNDNYKFEGTSEKVIKLESFAESPSSRLLRVVYTDFTVDSWNELFNISKPIIITKIFPHRSPAGCGGMGQYQGMMSEKVSEPSWDNSTKSFKHQLSNKFTIKRPTVYSGTVPNKANQFFNETMDFFNSFGFRGTPLLDSLVGVFKVEPGSNDYSYNQVGYNFSVISSINDGNYIICPDGIKFAPTTPPPSVSVNGTVDMSASYPISGANFAFLIEYIDLTPYL